MNWIKHSKIKSDDEQIQLLHFSITIIQKTWNLKILINKKCSLPLNWIDNLYLYYIEQTKQTI